MDDSEIVARVGIVTKAMQAFGITDSARVKAIVDLTIGIPWISPPRRGEDPKPPVPLFAAAVARAAMSKTYGAPGPGDILDAAIEIDGRITTEQGHTSMRRWVHEAMDPAKALGIPTARLLEIGSGFDTRSSELSLRQAGGAGA